MPPTRVERKGTPGPSRPRSRPVDDEDMAPIGNSSERRKSAVLDLIGYISIPLVGKATLDEARLAENEISPYALDVQTIGMHKNSFAEAIVDLANEYPVIGVMLDKVGIVGPMGALVMISVTIAAQFAENHGALPEQMRSVAPVIPREDLANALRADINKAKAKAAPNGSES